MRIPRVSFNTLALTLAVVLSVLSLVLSIRRGRVPMAVYAQTLQDQVNYKEMIATQCIIQFKTVRTTSESVVRHLRDAVESGEGMEQALADANEFLESLVTR